MKLLYLVVLLGVQLNAIDGAVRMGWVKQCSFGGGGSCHTSIRQGVTRTKTDSTGSEVSDTEGNSNSNSQSQSFSQGEVESVNSQLTVGTSAFVGISGLGGAELSVSGSSGSESSSSTNRENANTVGVELSKSHSVVSTVNRLMSAETSTGSECSINIFNDDRCGNLAVWQWQVVVDGFEIRTCELFPTCDGFRPSCLPGCCDDEYCQYCKYTPSCPDGFPQAPNGKWKRWQNIMLGDEFTLSGEVSRKDGRDWTDRMTETAYASLRDRFVMEGVRGKFKIPYDNEMIRNVKAFLLNEQTTSFDCLSTVSENDYRLGECDGWATLWQWQVSVKDFTVDTCEYALACSHHDKPNCLPGCCMDSHCQYCSQEPPCIPGFPNGIDECASIPCANGGTCFDDGDKFSCRCAYGFFGETCEIIDECTSNPCANGGTCSYDGRKFSCQCADGFIGDRCAKRNEGIFLFGGYSRGYVRSVIRFNPDLNIMERHPMRLRAIMKADMMANGTAIISAWGKDSPWKGYALYSTVDNRVIKQMDHIPFIADHPAAAIAGSVYANCGRNVSTNWYGCVLYNTATGNYNTIRLRVKSHGCMVALNDSTVLWMGGTTDSVFMIDVNTGQYRNIANLPQQRREPGCTLYGENRVVMCGGWGSSGSDRSCSVLSLDNRRWHNMASLNEGRRGPGLVNWKGTLYVIGGWDGPKNPKMEYYDGSAWHISKIQLPMDHYVNFGSAVLQQYEYLG